MTTSIGILGTGDMGSTVGATLRRAGYRVLTALDERSAASRELAKRAGMEDLVTLERLIGECDVLLSILPPAAAYDFARTAASIISAGKGRELVFAECNAVAPATLKQIERLFADTPARFVDVGIVGPPPRSTGSSPTRFYVAGIHREQILAIRSPAIRMIDMGTETGRASAIKMCYAALNKGVDALYTNILLGARQLGVEQELMDELEGSQAEAASRVRRRIPFLAATAARYTGEMHEIAATFDAAGVSGDFHRGAAWLYGVLAKSSLAAETRATLPQERSLEEAITAFAAALDATADKS
jgi:3-hydroxyisobutyrate dehydrogenase-like beta-hydroxyacid dehydrogenase